jgi:leucyl aminopeptidase
MSAKKSTQDKEIRNLVYAIENLKDLAQLELTLAEVEYAKTHLKETNKVVFIQQLSLCTAIVRMKKTNDFQSKQKLRNLGATITETFNKNKAEEAVFETLVKSDDALCIAEGMILANYQFLKYFTQKDKKKNSLEAVYIKETNLTKAKIDELMIVLESTYKARDLVNEPVSYLNAVKLAEEIEQMGDEAGFKVEVLDQLKIETLKMGGLLAVNKGSVDPATFTIMEWKPKKHKNKQPIILVGKGVVYDTGGLSLKPTPASMDVMKCDMAGAATVACAMAAIAKAELPIYVIGLVPATDNRPGGNAYAPGDVVRMFDGSTVEVLNTDAEGRMILADALSYAKKYKPELVIDFATLTGSAVRAIGYYASVMMGTADEKTFKALAESGEEVYERMFQFPFYEEYGEEIKSSIADIKNIGSNEGGAITAGKFLAHFTDYPFVHVDIAGPAFLNTDSTYLKKGGTGVGVRMIFEFLKNY